MKARCCSYLSVFITAPDGLIGKVLRSRRAREAGANRCLFSVRCSYQTSFCWPCSYTQWVCVKSSVQQRLGLCFTSSFLSQHQKAFLFKSFSFSFTPEPLQLRQNCNLPAAAFVLAFQEAGEQCESFLISLRTNEIFRQARRGYNPTAQVVEKGGKASLIKAQQNQV